jgi:hypothetical protein
MPAWLANNSSMIFFLAQLLYWFVTLVLLTYAVFQFKRLVNFQLGIGKSGKLPGAGGGTAAKKSGVSVEEFVE